MMEKTTQCGTILTAGLSLMFCLCAQGDAQDKQEVTAEVFLAGMGLRIADGEWEYNPRKRLLIATGGGVMRLESISSTLTEMRLKCTVYTEGFRKMEAWVLHGDMNPGFGFALQEGEAHVFDMKRVGNIDSGGLMGNSNDRFERTEVQTRKIKNTAKIPVEVSVDGKTRLTVAVGGRKLHGATSKYRNTQGGAVLEVHADRCMIHGLRFSGK